MPVVELHILEGYGSDVKTRLGETLTDAVRFVLPAQPDAVTVMIHEMPADQYFRGRKNRIPAAALPDPKEIVLDFLNAMQSRDLEAAAAHLSPDFEMRFPGDVRMTSLQGLVEWAKSRYVSFEKTYEKFDALQSPEGPAIVYCFGHLSGRWTDGTAFQGIRFIDRFELVNSRITRQDVWNDIAEVGTGL